MNTITQNSAVHVAMDGQTLYKSSNVRNSISGGAKAAVIEQSITPTGAQVAQTLEKSIQQIKADTQELQKMSKMVAGNKLQFNVNKELNDVIVSIVDSSTNQVVKQIPSEAIQHLKIRIRKAIGLLFDQTV